MDRGVTAARSGNARGLSRPSPAREVAALRGGKGRRWSLPILRPTRHPSRVGRGHERSCDRDGEPYAKRFESNQVETATGQSSTSLVLGLPRAEHTRTRIYVTSLTRYIYTVK